LNLTATLSGKKKYSSLTDGIEELAKELRTHPTKGTPIGPSCYKIRLAIKSKGKGKSGGARVITYYYIHGSTVYLLSIYDKAEMENISDKKLPNYCWRLRKALTLSRYRKMTKLDCTVTGMKLDFANFAVKKVTARTAKDNFKPFVVSSLTHTSVIIPAFSGRVYDR